METERQVLELIATDRIDIPISSMSGKLKRSKPKLARAIDLSDVEGQFMGDRTYARVESEDIMKARGMREGIDRFCEEHPRHGDVLKGYIAEQRVKSETHMYFGMHEGCKLTQNDYMDVMRNLGFSEGVARDLYPDLMNISRNLSRKRDEERRILIG